MAFIIKIKWITVHYSMKFGIVLRRNCINRYSKNSWQNWKVFTKEQEQIQILKTDKIRQKFLIN